VTPTAAESHTDEDPVGAYSVTAFDAKPARGSGSGNPGRDLLRELPRWEVPHAREPHTRTSRQGSVCLSYLLCRFW
jgi:hypothetical protein